jgi:hypothetical protein
MLLFGNARGKRMRLTADQIYACPKEDDYPASVGFRDGTADFNIVLSRFSDLEPDDGTVEVLVGDQAHARTANLAVRLDRGRCRIVLDQPTAERLLGDREYVVDFQADEATYARMVQLLGTIFQGLPGLTTGDGADAAEAGFEPDRRPPAR